MLLILTKSPVYHWLSTFPIYYYHKSSFESDYEGGKRMAKVNSIFDKNLELWIPSSMESSILVLP